MDDEKRITLIALNQLRIEDDRLAAELAPWDEVLAWIEQGTPAEDEALFGIPPAVEFVTGEGSE